MRSASCEDSSPSSCPSSAMTRHSRRVIAIITGRTSRCVELRAKNLGITRLYQGVEDKLAVMQSLLADMKLAPEAAAFMGDDEG